MFHLTPANYCLLSLQNSAYITFLQSNFPNLRTISGPFYLDHYNSLSFLVLTILGKDK